MVTFRSRRRVVQRGRVAAYTGRRRPIVDTQYIIVTNMTKSIFHQAFVKILNTWLSLSLDKQIRVPTVFFNYFFWFIVLEFTVDQFPSTIVYIFIIISHNICNHLYNLVEIRYTLVFLNPLNFKINSNIRWKFLLSLHNWWKH